MWDGQSHARADKRADLVPCLLILQYYNRYMRVNMGSGKNNVEKLLKLLKNTCPIYWTAICTKARG